MTVLPVIIREIRAQARLPSNYYLRVMGAAALMLMGAFFIFKSGLSPDAGGQFFGLLHFQLFMVIWILVPLLAADCISKERREGTVGLLFLTPLKARDIVLAKGLVHGLRAVTLWLAVLPVLTIPFLQGGVSWREAVLSMLVIFSSLCLALAAGLLASTLSKSWLRAQILACLLAGCLAFGFIVVTGGLIANLMRLTGPAGPGRAYTYGMAGYFQGSNLTLEYAFQIGFLALTDLDAPWSMLLGARGGIPVSTWLWGAGVMALASAGCLLLAIQLAAARLRRVWQEEPPSAGRRWLEEKLFTPVVGVSFLRGWMRRKLEKNPIGWLEQRTWSGRVVMWGWFAVMISLYGALVGGDYGYDTIFRLQVFMAWVLLIGLAASASGSFQRERETGVMELLLVSPLSVGRIIEGRLRGLWGQFLPAMVLMVVVSLYFNDALSQSENIGSWMRFFAVAFVTVPMAGLYHSLARKNFVGAFLMTVFTALLLPLLLRGLALFMLDSWVPDFDVQMAYVGPARWWHQRHFELPGARLFVEIVCSGWIIIVLQMAIAAWVGWRLHRDMVRRNFAFSRAIT
jgi:ABC-type transport system involved in multi-copper enzyme maturation permease subunit